MQRKLKKSWAGKSWMGGESEWIIQLHSVLIHQLLEFTWANLQEDQVAIVVVITVAIIAVVEAMVVVAMVVDAVLAQDRMERK